MHRILRPLLVFLAIVFLIEAWLWDRLEPVVARILVSFPLLRFKAALARLIDTLPPVGTLILLALPAAAVSRPTSNTNAVVPIAPNFANTNTPAPSIQAPVAISQNASIFKGSTHPWCAERRCRGLMST